MDKIKKYEVILEKIVNQYATIKYLNSQINNSVLIDKINKRFMVVSMGWENYKRVHGCPIHFDIINNKVWIQTDRTDYGIANDLIDMGIPKTDIVLAYKSERVAKNLGFALA